MQSAPLDKRDELLAGIGLALLCVAFTLICRPSPRAAVPPAPKPPVYVMPVQVPDFTAPRPAPRAKTGLATPDQSQVAPRFVTGNYR